MKTKKNKLKIQKDASSPVIAHTFFTLEKRFKDDFLRRAKDFALFAKPC